jgi:DNA-binding MarR family transcriptional regulator
MKTFNIGEAESGHFHADPFSVDLAGVSQPKKLRRGGRKSIAISAASAMKSMPWPSVSCKNVDKVERLSYLLKFLRSRGISFLLIQSMLVVNDCFGQEVYLSDIANAVETTTANVTGVADELQELGLAKRVPSKIDRRKITVVLTPYGQSFIDWVNDLFS